jgi:RHS repeat-associated protein
LTQPTGTSAELLDLPSGGGSVAGAGSSFNVDLNTGTGTAAFEFVLPTGPNGIRPPLSLTYATTSGAGPFGIGWSLGLATVTRKLSPGAESPDPAAVGTYSLVGVGDLVDMGGGRYRPVVDATGQLIEFDGTSWTVTDNHDTSFTLGTSPASRIGGDPPAAWLLDSCTDSSGHTISYSWIDDDGGLVPGTITWGTFQLLFLYETRPDEIVTGQYGAPITNTKRCNNIELHVTTEQPSLVRSWSLLYDDDGGRGRSLLANIREIGHGIDGSQLAAPDRSFTYTTPDAPAMVTMTGWTTSLDDPNTDLVDLDGDGLPDLLQIGTGWPSKRANLGGGSFGYPTTFELAPATISLSSPEVAFADMSGEGNVDLVVLSQRLSGYYPLSVPQEGSAPSTFGFPVTFSNAPSVLMADPRVRLLDLNGDGVTDVLVDAGNFWLGYLREEADSWAPVPRVFAADVTPPVVLTDPHVYLADMTGDGLTDIVRIDGGSVAYWPGRADGGWGDQITMTPSPTFDRFYDPTRMNVVDIDGDGCGDLVYVDAETVTVWRNVGGAQLADPMVVEHTPLARPGSYRLVDLLGTGTPGVLFQLPQLRSANCRQVFLDFCGGTKPYLLSAFTNGPGATTEITYRTSTSYALDDARAGSPWETYHPFPVQCVSRIDQTDNGTGVTRSSEYTYHSGRYDPVTRTFLGFAAVDCDQLGDSTCPTLRTRTTFHVGLDPSDLSRPLYGSDALVQGALRRRVLSTTTYGLDGTALADQPYSVTVNTYTALLVPSGLGDGNQVAVPHLTSTTEQRWEREASPASTRTTTILAVNDEGDVTKQRTVAARIGVAQADQDVTTVTTFASGGHNIRLPARVTQTTPGGTIVGITVNYYDGAGFIGLPEGQATQGLLTRVERLAFDDAFATAVWGTDLPDLASLGYHRQPGDSTGWWLDDQSYDRGSGATGPTLSTRNGIGGIQQMQYDPTGQKVVAVKDAMGNQSTATIDWRVWQTGTVTDANSQTLSDAFDALGRVTATVGPSDTPANPTTSYTYVVGPVSSVTSLSRITHGTDEVFTATTFLGGSGQVLGRCTPAPTPGEWIMANAITVNPRGLATSSYLPYGVSSAELTPPPPGTGAFSSIYDALGRSVQITRPDGLVTTTARDGSTLTISEQWPGGPAQEVERQVYDAAGQLIAVSRNAGDHWVQQTYAYDPAGSISIVTLPDGSTIAMQCDLLGRRMAQTSPDTGRTVYVLDAAHNEHLRTNAAGQTVSGTFDLACRRTALTYDSEAQPRVQYAYLDQGDTAPPDGITVNRYGRVWQVTDELGTVTLQYDEAGRVTTRARNVTGSPDQYVEQSSYDVLGRVTSATLPTGGGGTARTVLYEYGANGLPARASGVVDEASYDLLGRPVTIRYANGVAAAFWYEDNGGGLNRVRITDSEGTVLRDESVTRSEAYVTSVTSATNADDSVGFTYDPLRRLATADYSNGGAGLDNHTWAYDDLFRVVSDSDAGALVYRARTHQVASVAGQETIYDPAGRLTSGRAGSMTFDAADRLTALTTPGGTVITHTYDYGGHRARSVTGGAQTYLMPLPDVEIQNGRRVCWIRFGRVRVAADVDGSLWFLHTNALGRSDLITDAAGHESGRVRQTPYSALRPDYSPPGAGPLAAVAVLLIGADASGLICMGLRWYDPLLGQFVSPDPLVPGAYVVGAWNPYVYCLGNPVALRDPSGASFTSIMEAIGVAVLATVCVVGAIFTCGASLLGLAAMTSLTALDFMAGVTVGTFGASLAGAISAQNANGNLWEGAFVGALLGGATSLIGGALGAIAANAINAGLVTTAGAGVSTPYMSFWSFVVSGLIQGTIAGAGTGLATGFAGGKGSADAMLMSMAQGAIWGGTLGGLMGVGLGSVLSGQNPNQYLNFFNIIEKFGQGNLNSVDNAANGIQSVAQMAVPNGGGFSFSNVAGFMGNFVSNGPTAGGLYSISIIGLQEMVSNAGLAAAVDVSMAADQLGFSYAAQVVSLLGLAPYFVDVIVAQAQLSDPNGLANLEEGFNTKYAGSSHPYAV